MSIGIGTLARLRVPQVGRSEEGAQTDRWAVREAQQLSVESEPLVAVLVFHDPRRQGTVTLLHVFDEVRRLSHITHPAHYHDSAHFYIPPFASFFLAVVGNMP